MENQEKLFSYLKRTAAELQETRARLRKLESGARDPLAIVGMGCRFPGGVQTPEDLWDLVVDGRDAVSAFPQDRGWEDDPAFQGQEYAPVGGFIYDAAAFDPTFFGISPREALAMDPQQRMLLEVAWESLERSGIDPRSLRGSSTGVFVGAAMSGYADGVATTQGSEGYVLTGNVTSVISGRVSYVLGLEGPAVTVDTACSSSLVALHLACQAVRAGECDMALAGGVAVMVTPGAFAEFSRQQGLAADGRCKAFAGAADGMGWAEGAGVVVVERLSEARRKGHRVLAVVAGSAVNQDGASNGLTAPNGPSQQRVIRAALASAGLSPGEVDVVEAHGTGTTLGDPIEAQALIATYGRGRDEERPLWLGSVKSNIGHAQCAAGMAGVIKTVMALQRSALPRTLHVDEPTPQVDWSAGAVRLLTENTPWPENGRPRRAGVSAFGVSGTNVHTILEQSPGEAVGDDDGADGFDDASEHAVTEEPAAPVVPLLVPGAVAPVWLVSGRSREGLAAQAGRLREFVSARPELSASDVAWSLAATRSVFERRAVVTGADRDGVLSGLAALVAGVPAAGVFAGEVPAGGLGRVVFVFPGQGSQWAGMGAELASVSPVFAASLAECEAALSPFVDWSLRDVLSGGRDLERVDVVQPALWAVMVSLAAVWQAAGVVPDAVVGHSQGEIAAACVAGVLSLEDGARVVALRSQALRVLGGRGGMLSVAAGEEAVRARIEAYGDRVSVAALNGPAATVVSGELQALEELAAACEADGVRARILPVDYASHSSQVEELEARIRAALDGLTPQAGAVPVVSSLTGELIDGSRMDAGYWYESLRATVRFSQAVATLARDGHGVFVETSPHPVLTGAVTDTVEAALAQTSEDDGAEAAGLAVAGTLRRDDGGASRLVASLAEAYVRGVRVDWTAVLPAVPWVDLPTYAFQRQRFWPRADRSAAGGAAAGGDGAGAEADARFWAAVEGGDLGGLATALAVDEDRPLREVLPAMASWRRRERDRAATGSWWYRVSWVPVAEPGPGALSGTWLLVVPARGAGAGMGGPVAGMLAARGARITTLEVDLHDVDRAGLAGRLAEAVASFDVAGVVSLLALSGERLADAPAVPAGVAGSMVLVQALGDALLQAPLWMVTSGGADTGDGAVDPVQAQVWGLGRVAGLEHPDRWGGLVDLPEVLDEVVADRLAGVLAGCGEDQVVVRRGGALARRVVRRSAPADRAEGREWGPRGTVLVTGASGAIGPHLVRWLSRAGARRLVVTSRRGAALDGLARTVAELADSGTGVGVAACDVSQRHQVETLLGWIDRTGEPLRSVVHAAVAVDLLPVTATSVDHLAVTLAAKVDGARWLDELTADLDDFILFSSIAATWGGTEHAAYAAANAALDALADDRRARGLPATSVAWGVWEAGSKVTPGQEETGREPADRTGGADAGQDAADRMPSSASPVWLRRQGVRFLAPESALTALGQALGAGETRAAVADMDWGRFVPVYTASRHWRLLDALAEEAAREEDAASAASGAAGDPGSGVAEDAPGGLAALVAGLDGAARERAAVELVRSHAAVVLGHDAPTGVAAGQAFREMGFDSLTAVELRTRLNGATGLRLPSTVVFDYPSPRALARHVLSFLPGGGDTTAAVGAALASVGPGTDSDPVVVTGMACRLPGGVASPEQLWELLASGADATGGFPADRGWDLAGLLASDAASDGTSYVSRGGFVSGAAEFDAGFFGISPREALAMDPQQRLLLETSWEALERAGIDPAGLRGEPVGVFAGAAASGYGTVGSQEGAEGHGITGNATSVISGRVSYVLGLEGPSVTLDTACSSSLVALHLAVRAVRAGECSMALAGGVMVIVSPDEFVGFSQQGALAADGRCKAFGADADGMGLAEGAGMVVVERLSAARRAGRPVLAVVAGSAVNQDGASNGLTAPNGPSQQRVIRAALASAGLSAGQVDAVEAHGTGTTLGDPIEAQALIATYGQERSEDRPVWLGSVKSNIGHAQQASGIAGVIKMVLALEHESIPATLHADEPSPHVEWGAGNVRLASRAVAWPSAPGGEPRRAGVSAFGISGTNAHVILEEPPATPADGSAGSGAPDDHDRREETALTGPDRTGQPSAPDTDGTVPVLTAETGVSGWLVSARSREGLAAQAGRLREFASAAPGADPADVAWSLATTRSVFEYRAVVTGAGRDELLTGLAAVAEGIPAAGVVTGPVPVDGDTGQVAFVFPGQGSQWIGMGTELARTSPVFAARLAECEAALAPYGDWSLREVLFQQKDLERVDVVQPALWAVMVSLAALWRAAGVTPDAVVGHSQGEIAAACVAGVLSLEDGARVVALRSQALRALAGRGGMLSIAAGEDAVRSRIEPYGGRVSVAALNGPSATVVSGEPAALEELAAACENDGVRARVLPVDYASHSPQVEELETRIRAALDGLAPRAGAIAVVSSLTGRSIDGTRMDAGYWYESLRAPVRFAQAVTTLAHSGHRVFVETSAHPVLTGAVTDTVEAASGGDGLVVTGTLRRDDGGPARLLASLAEVHVRGVTVDWTAVLPAAQRIGLPTYAFQRERYWPRPGAGGGNVAAAGLGTVGHPLLGAFVGLADGAGTVFTGRLSLAAQPWLADHAVGGTVLFPGTAFVELALQAGHRAGCGRIVELALETPLVLPPDGGVQLQVVLSAPDDQDQRTFETYARPDSGDPEEPWIRHASGLLAPADPPSPAAETAPDAVLEAAEWPPAGAVPVDISGLYGSVAAAGYGFGPAFQGLRAAWRRDQDVFAEVALPDVISDSADQFGVHPALLDATLHALAVATAPADDEAEPEPVKMPFSWQDVSLSAVGAGVLRARLRLRTDGSVTVTAADTAGAPVVSIRSLVLRPVVAGQLAATGDRPQDTLFGVAWEPITASGGAPGGRWAVVGTGPADLGDLLTRAAGDGADIARHPDLTALVDAVGAGEPVPDVVLVGAGSRLRPGDDVAVSARQATAQALALVQRWLAADDLGAARLVLVTRGAVATATGEGVVDMGGAALWGLVRSAQSENPGRLVLADLPADGIDGASVLLGALGGAEPELAVRAGVVHARRLARPTPGLVPPVGDAWRLEAVSRGTLDGLALVEHPSAAAPLEAGEIRVAVRAAGVNFRDVMATLDLLPLERDPDGGLLGSEVAGVVTETGSAVSGIAVGDRVLGMLSGGAGPVAVLDARLAALIPVGLTFAQAAAVPVAFATAWYGLVDLARVRPGGRVLVHAAAGGVGMAAVTIARHLGLEVFATASPGKWGALTAMGLDEAHLASSRDAGFEERFLAATGGAGMDVVLNALAGELTDASLRLLCNGGEFVEMGKTDIRDAAQVAADHPGVRYRAFSTGEAGADRLAEILAEITALLAGGQLTAPPVRCWDIRRAPDALRYMSQARHTGKIVLTVPTTLRPAAHRSAGTVLVTGGTGLIGRLVARHLTATGQARQMILTSRSGPAAEGAAALAADVAALGADVQIAVCDAAERPALAAVLDRVAPANPLTGVIHAAGVLDDGVIGSLSPDRIDTVMRPKADAAWNLHELTLHHDLDGFVLFSSAAASLGGPGQGNYAAANAFLDALAARRRADGRPGTSLAWGLWADASAMTGHLGERERARISQGGMRALSAEEGLALLDAAAARDETLLIPAGFDVAALRARVARGGTVPPLWRTLAGTGGRLPSAGTGAGAAVQTLRRTLAGLSATDRDHTLLDLVRSHAAAVLGHASPQAVEAARAFKDLGFDSLTAVELRNRLSAATGLRLPATLIFDYPTPLALAAHLGDGLLGSAPRTAVADTPAALPAPDDDPVAIVAMSCRLPGGIADPEAFWELLEAGRDAVGDCPGDRGWDVDRLYDPDHGTPGTAYTLQGGYLDGAGSFDPGFFGISPREAFAMDPQQRVLLESAWEAFERASITPDSLRGTSVGVYIGATSSGYHELLGSAAEEAEGYLMTGNTGSVISGRISYALGLEGPAVTVDTACSSGLVAMHLASQALRAGECHLALAGGVAIMGTPAAFTEFSRQRGLAPDGRCKSFAEGADGTGWGEGAGLLVLERLSDARRLGHPVLAVVAGSAINQDGASNGLAAPNGPSQQRVIRAALANARLRPGQVDVVEGHGTGTVLGDPIEAQALLATYGQERPEGRPLWLGSVKSNIGHTQSAAGVVGVIKMVLALRNERLPVSLHAPEPSSHVDWSAGDIRLLTDPVEWPAGDEPRRAGVSSFGLSGTNAHLILQEAPGAPGGERPDGPAPAGPRLPVVPWVLSARGAEALRAQAGRLRDLLAQHPGIDAGDVGFSLATSRSVFGRRAVVLGADRDELLAGLDAVADGAAAPDGQAVVTGTASLAMAHSKVAFVVPALDVPALTAAGRLLDEAPAFATRMAECEQALSPHLNFAVTDVLRARPGAPSPERAAILRPVAFAVQVALAALWRSAGLSPAAVAGRGDGELAAAYLAGVLTLDDAARLAAGGAAPTEPGAVRPAAGTLPLLALDTARWLDGESLDAGYWCGARPAAGPVADAARELLDAGFGVLVEIGDEPVLAAELREQAAVGHGTAAVAVTGTLDGERPGLRGFLAGLAALHVAGTRVDWASVWADVTPRLVELPTYAFQHQWYWPSGDRREDDCRRDEPRDGHETPTDAGRAPDAEASPVEDPRFWEAVDQEDPAALGGLLGFGEPLSPDTPLSEVLARLAAWRRATAGAPVETVAEDEAAAEGGALVVDADGGAEAGPPALASRLARLAPDEREELLLELVREGVAQLLAYESPDLIDAEGDVLDMGMSSMAAVQLREQLSALTGLELPAGFMYDLVSPQGIAAYLAAEFVAQAEPPARAAE